MKPLNVVAVQITPLLAAGHHHHHHHHPGVQSVTLMLQPLVQACPSLMLQPLVHATTTRRQTQHMLQPVLQPLPAATATHLPQQELGCEWHYIGPVHQVVGVRHADVIAACVQA